jgi:predicted O-methyltransferase YrrM
MSFIVAARSKIETAAWFAARPALYRELLRRAIFFRFRTRRSTAAEARAKLAGTAWCLENQSSLGEVLAALGIAPDVQRIAERHPAEWTHAEQAFRRCQGKMGGPAHVDLLHHVVLHLRPQHVVETGVAAGWSSLAILTALEDNQRGRLTSVDMPYPKRNNEELVGCVVPEALRARWVLVRLPDRDALPGILRENEIQLAHYDSDKSYDGRMFAYHLIFGALQPGGVLVSDDVEDNLAFRDFARSVARQPWIFSKGHDNFAGLIVR